MPKNIFIYDPYASGHHAGFIRVMLDGFRRESGWRATLLTCGEASGHPSFRRLAAEYPDVLDMTVAETAIVPPLVAKVAGSFYAGQLENWLTVRREFPVLNASRRFDYAMIPYLEAVGVHNAAYWPAFGSVPWAAIPHGLRCHFRESGIKSPPRRVDALQALCFRRMLRQPGLHRVFAIDPYLARWANDPKVVFVPDPSPLPPQLDRDECRRALALPADAFVLLVYGAIDGRKCLDVLLPAAASIDPARRIVVVVAGTQDARVRDSVLRQEAAATLRAASLLVEFDRFVTNEEEARLFAACDAVWCYNRDTLGSSGVLIRAGQHARPVIVADAGLSGRVVGDERCGVVIGDARREDIAGAIVALRDDPRVREEMGRRAYARFREHVPETFAGAVRAAIAGASTAAAGAMAP
ncbi:MAG: glycosyltransferase family 4 protein [Burkholderiales bacterium]|nr:glycosyltransferase family 4 protein [Burkholderiales bacterium]